MANVNSTRRLKDWREVINTDFPKTEITERTKYVMRRVTSSGRYLINNMRLATGRVYTDLEYEARRAKILSTPLP